MPRTPFTELIGIGHPIVQGGMRWLGRAEVARAVSIAGGPGLLTALTQPTQDDMRREIDGCQTMIDKPEPGKPGAGLTHDIPPVAVLVSRIIMDAQAIIARRLPHFACLIIGGGCTA